MRSPKHLLKDLLSVSRDDDAVLRAIEQVFVDQIAFPIQGQVVGAPVTVLGVSYDGDHRHGLQATVRRGGRVWSVALVDVGLPDEHAAACLGAYRTWLGLPLDPDPVTEEAELSNLVVLSVRQRSARCRYLGASREVTLRTAELHGVVPGEVLTVRIRKSWVQDGCPYVSGRIEARRVDIEGLELQKLGLEPAGVWDPRDVWDADFPPDEWARAQLKRGRRARFKLEEVRPRLAGAHFEDPVLEAAELETGGQADEARRLRQDTLHVELRCLAAHAQLGRTLMEIDTVTAGRHYEIGSCIGRLSLPADFNGVLPWVLPSNRPFLRCLHGWGLSLWRQGRNEAAMAVFSELMLVNPADPQGVRHLLPTLEAGERWDGR